MDIYRAPVSRFMVAPVVAIRADDGVARAEEATRASQISAVLVVDERQRPVGVISRKDLLRHQGAGGPAAALMSRPVVAVGPGATAQDACRELATRRIHRVFVVDGERAIGVFSTREALTVVRLARAARPLGDVAARNIIAVEPTAPVAEAAARLAAAGIGGVVVLEGTLPVGLLTEREVLAARTLPPSATVEEAMTCALLCLPAETPLFRAAGFALQTSARRILVTEKHHLAGVVTGFDFARVVAES